MDADRNNEIDYDDRWLEIVYEESFGEADKRIISWAKAQLQATLDETDVQSDAKMLHFWSMIPLTMVKTAHELGGWDEPLGYGPMPQP